jgi:SAM-dependent methyltransferase
MNCHLCDSTSSQKLFSDDFRRYYHCEKCGLIFVPANDHVSVKEEKKRYTLHDNDIGHAGYVKFLTELVRVIGERANPSGRILDYGSGPEEVLTRLLRKNGYDCTSYDPLYDIGKEAFSKTYDTVVLCEVLEHLRGLRAEIEKIKKILNPASVIIIRTQLHPPPGDFANWWYKNDSTHVNFFSRESVDVMAAMLGRKKVVTAAEDIFIVADR